MVHLAADAVDHRGSPADKCKTGGWLPASLILGTMHLPSATSANIVTDFMGTCLLLSLLGGFLADSFLGRYRTIAIFASVQTPGTGMLAVSTRLPQFRPPPCHAQSTTICAQASASQMAMLYASLYVIAVGTGGLKSSVSGFGTDQFDENDDKEKQEMNLFFGRFFFLVSLGTMMAVTVLVYVQDEVGRCLGYGICTISMLIAILIFLAGSQKYRYKKTSSGSTLIHIFQVLVAAVRKRSLQVPKDANLLYVISAESLRIHHSDQFNFLDKAAIITREDYAENNIGSPNPWTLCSITKVEEVKMMIRLLPTWATTITFWATHAQMITFSVEQASTMYRYIGGFQIPAGSLTVFLVAAILISLAVYDLFIIPTLQYRIGKPGFTNLQRIGIGLLLSALGMAAAALAEKRRLANAKEIAQSTATQPISVFLLIPQFLLVGCGEAFIYTGQLDFFITQSPKGMKTISTALFLTTLSLGFFLSSLLVSVVKKVTGWVGDRIDNGRLDCFYGLLAILSFINFWLFLLCAKWYRSKTTRKDLAVESVEKGEDER
ncbi:UNVERIFIED_CONTAM: protein NRT1/ PTR FAMILY 6.2 [Sesamum radiatum]|uniref:Protein NRT1/ PTR FAMILY 6.2 n=1 Tax=Sesamum radiatum TaxID=300843 RepID=A0AAW2MGW0_SESRA